MGSNNFVYLDKHKLDLFLPELYAILHSNMAAIAPTGNSYEEDFQVWYSNVMPAMQKAPRQIVLMYVEGSLAGYFQYYINAATNSLMMEEIQIKAPYHGTGLFTAFYKWLTNQLPEDVLSVEAYAHKTNSKSQGILAYLGLTCQGENKNGNTFYYKGNYADLLQKCR